MLTHPQDGRIKLFVTLQALAARQRYPELFANGEYLPLEVTGSKSAHIFAFARRCGDCRAVVAVPRLVAGLFGDAAAAPDPAIWEDTAITLPAAGPWPPRRWLAAISAASPCSPLSRQWRRFP
jgi:(1->4)-alpha-D-glucan 1-alpha-D-glucosylmutase